MEPAKSSAVFHTTKGDYTMEKLMDTSTKMLEKFNIDSKNKGRVQAEKEGEEELKKNGIGESVDTLLRFSYYCMLFNMKLRKGRLENEEESQTMKRFEEKPAAIYIVDTKGWNNIRLSMDKDKICYTSAKKVKGEIEIRVTNSIQHLKVLSYFLEKGIEHKTFLSRFTEELPEYMQEMRRRKNKAQRDCQRYPSHENKRLFNQLARDYKRELGNLRFNEYENDKFSILNNEALELVLNDER